ELAARTRKVTGTAQRFADRQVHRGISRRELGDPGTDGARSLVGDTRFTEHDLALELVHRRVARIGRQEVVELGQRVAGLTALGQLGYPLELVVCRGRDIGERLT